MQSPSEEKHNPCPSWRDLWSTKIIRCDLPYLDNSVHPGPQAHRCDATPIIIQQIPENDTLWANPLHSFRFPYHEGKGVADQHTVKTARNQDLQHGAKSYIQKKSEGSSTTPTYFHIYIYNYLNLSAQLETSITKHETTTNFLRPRSSPPRASCTLNLNFSILLSVAWPQCRPCPPFPQLPYLWVLQTFLKWWVD